MILFSYLKIKSPNLYKMCRFRTSWEFQSITQNWNLHSEFIKALAPLWYTEVSEHTCARFTHKQTLQLKGCKCGFTVSVLLNFYSIFHHKKPDKNHQNLHCGLAQECETIYIYCIKRISWNWSLTRRPVDSGNALWLKLYKNTNLVRKKNLNLIWIDSAVDSELMTSFPFSFFLCNKWVKDVSDLETSIDYFALLGTSCKEFDFSVHLF